MGLQFFARPSVGAVLLIASLMMKQATAFGQMVPYNGTVCNGFIDYNVWLPDGGSIATIEQGLMQSKVLENTGNMVDPCRSAYLSYTCSVAYPRPVKTGQTNSFNVLFACQSSCQAVVSKCTADFQYTNTIQLLPDCNAVLPNTDKYPGGSVRLQPDDSCNAVGVKSANATCAIARTECPLPLVKDNVYALTNGQRNTDDANCECGCCIPCPQTNAYYKDGILDQGFFITDVLKAVSAFLSLVLVISYLVLPDKLQHPSNLILFSAIATTIFLAAVGPSFGDPRRVQCAADGVHVASSHNNTLCAIQGAWVVFGAIATVAWLSIVIINLHLHTVWNSSWLSRRAWLSHLLGWVIPAAFAAIAVVTKNLGWNNSNMCMATAETAGVLLFIPLGIIMVPATILHFATFGHIIKVTLQAENSETVSHSTLSSGKAARISHRRHVMNAIRIQWRAAALALVISSSVLLYWAFYVVEGGKTDLSWMSTWKLCIFNKEGQETCGNKYAKGHVPDFLFMMITEALVSTTGLWIFLLFFKKSLVMEWKEKISGWACCGGSRTRRREEDQFYVI
ncbi:hypothetical protein BGZ74_010805 [Mortierella antarctica]|nr:hypothetical protein BGZ74_010805 [Mortierella antarctica]